MNDHLSAVPRSAIWKRMLLGVASLHPRARQTFLAALVLFVFASVAVILTASSRFMVPVPVKGGKLTEGIIERPRFINPVLAKSNADRNMTALVYSGLLRGTKDGGLVPDLADSYAVSEDGLVYTFTLKSDLYWQDGEPLTAADVVYTIEKVKDPSLAIKSPRRASWEGVSVEAQDEHTVIFTLKTPYAPFLENATLGILPKHIWEHIGNDEFDVSYYNIDPVGSGPYRVAKIVQDNTKGLPLSYELSSFPGYALGEPYVSDLSMRFFGNNADLLSAYQEGVVDQFPTVDPEAAQAIEKAGGGVARMHLPLIDAAFFNQNQQPIFSDANVRKALARAVDKDRIVRDVILGYGRPVDGPVSGLAVPVGATSTPSSGDKDAARALLEKAGWAIDPETGLAGKTDKKTKKTAPLEFSISVPDVDELRHTAELLKEDWGAIGANVTVKVFETGTFASEILAPRKYDVLVYGIIGRADDPYPYWHSSQRNSPGANVAMYTSKEADSLLEKIRKTSDPIEREGLLVKFEDAVEKDTPAVFLYSPDFLYATSPRVKGMVNGTIIVESDRFLDIADWHMETENVWGFLEAAAARTPEHESRVALGIRRFLSRFK